MSGTNGGRKFRTAALGCWLLAGACAACGADLRVGAVLVATEKSHDPDFARSSVVLIQYDAESAMGLIIGKATDVPVSDLLPEAKRGQVTIYAGGPLAIGVRGLVRTKSAPYFRVVTKKAELLKLIERGTPASDFRIYAGYVGWTAQQLWSEIDRGLWKVEAADARAIFDAGH
jgi:putative transcriptional regulator